MSYRTRSPSTLCYLHITFTPWWRRSAASVAWQWLHYLSSSSSSLNSSFCHVAKSRVSGEPFLCRLPRFSSHCQSSTAYQTKTRRVLVDAGALSATSALLACSRTLSREEPCRLQLILKSHQSDSTWLNLHYSSVGQCTPEGLPVRMDWLVKANTQHSVPHRLRSMSYCTRCITGACAFNQGLLFDSKVGSCMDECDVGGKSSHKHGGGC